jgi:septal ring factor EnvC (AmiA/AmiB activator)
MNPLMRDTRLSTQRSGAFAIGGSQPIALAAATLLVLVAGVAAVMFARAYTAASPEAERAAAVRQLQASTARISEQLLEKTKGLESTQQESIDQLQMMQDQLQTVRHLLAAQQADTKRLSEQVAALTESVNGLRQSFASAQPSEPSPAPAHNRSLHARAHAGGSAHDHRRSRS